MPSYPHLGDLLPIQANVIALELSLGYIANALNLLIELDQRGLLRLVSFDRLVK